MPVERSVDGPGRLPMIVCGSCAFNLWLPVADLSVSTLGLYSDVRFPGRCLLAYTVEHVEEVADLRGGDADAFFADVRRACAAVKAVSGCDRVNVAFLGNTVSHLHAHLIPRRVAQEPKPSRPPWEDPRPSGSCRPTCARRWPAPSQSSSPAAAGRSRRDRFAATRQLSAGRRGAGRGHTRAGYMSKGQVRCQSTAGVG